MSERMTNILGYLTLAAIMAAIWILFGEDPTRDQGARGERTFAGLSERINETAAITLTKTDAAVSLVREGEQWQVASKFGYPADQEQVRSVLRGFALSERREPKTANASRFPALELGDAATNVVLSDDTGGVLLDVQAGKRKEGGSGRSLTYIFQATDTRSWLVSGIEALPMDPTEWLDTSLLDIAPQRIQSVTLNGVTLTRELGDTNYSVASIADGEVPAASFKLAEPARTLGRLSLEDIQKTANPLMDPVANGTLKTHDGLTLTVTLFDSDDDNWVQLDANYSAEDASEGDAGTLDGAPADGAAEAAAIDERVQGWLFKVSGFAADILRQTRDDFIESSDADAAAS